MKKSGLLLSLLSGLLFFVLYLSTMPQVNVGYADSDEFLSLANHLGVAQPPGYRLYIFLLHGFMRFPLFNLSLAAKANLSSVIFASLTLVITNISLLHLYHRLRLKRESQSEQNILASIGTLTLGFFNLFWLYGLIATPYTLTVFFVALFLFLLTLTLRRYPLQPPPVYILILLSLTLGISIVHEPMLLSLFPPALYILFTFKHRLPISTYLIMFSALFIAAVLPLSLYFYPPSSTTALTWPLTPTLSGLNTYFRNLNLVSFNQSRLYFSQSLSVNRDLNQVVDSLLYYFKYLARSLNYWPIPIFILGVWQSYKRHRLIFLPYYLTFICLILIFAGSTRQTSDWGTLALIHRRFLPTLVLLPYLIYIGWFSFLRRSSKFLHILVPRLSTPSFLLVVLGCLLIPQGLIAYRQVNLRHYTLVSERYHTMIQEFKPNALVTCYSDISCFALIYEQSVNQLRPDVTIFPLSYPMVTLIKENAPLNGFTYTSNPFLILDIISWNLGTRPVYAVELSDYYYTSLGLDFPFLYYIPYGNYGELSLSLPKTLPVPSKFQTEAWLATPTNFSDPMQLLHKSTPARDHLLNGQFYNKMNLRPQSLSEFNQAANLYFQFSYPDKKQFTQLRASLEQYRGESKFKPGSSVLTSQQLFKQITKLLEQNFNGQAYKAAIAAMVVDPRNPRVHLTLADIFEKMGDYGFAQKEYQHTLILDPENKIAQERLKSISSLQPLETQ